MKVNNASRSGLFQSRSLYPTLELNGAAPGGGGRMRAQRDGGHFCTISTSEGAKKAPTTTDSIKHRISHSRDLALLSRRPRPTRPSASSPGSIAGGACFQWALIPFSLLLLALEPLSFSADEKREICSLSAAACSASKSVCRKSGDVLGDRRRSDRWVGGWMD